MQQLIVHLLHLRQLLPVTITENGAAWVQVGLSHLPLSHFLHLQLLAEIAEAGDWIRQSNSPSMILESALISCSCQLVVDLQLSRFLLEDLGVDVNDLLHYRWRGPLVQATNAVLQVPFELVLACKHHSGSGLHPLAGMVEGWDAFAALLYERRHRP